MSNKTIYLDALRGPLAVKPLSINDNDGGTVTVKVTARNVHSGYQRGEVVTVSAYSIVRLLSGQRCYSVGTEAIRSIINEKSKKLTGEK